MSDRPYAIEDFRQGITTKQRARLGTGEPVMTKIDGYWIKSGSLVPMRGISVVGAQDMDIVADQPLLGMVRYKGSPYILAHARGSSWGSTLSDTDYTIISMASHGGKLYAGTEEGILLVWDESWWKSGPDLTNDITALYSDGDYLYIGVSDAAGGVIYRYDGTDCVLSRALDATRPNINGFCEFNGDIYATTSVGLLKLHAGTWSVADTWAGTAPEYTAIAAIGTTLYIGTATAGKMVIYNGTTFTHADVAIDEPVHSLCVSGGFLYAGTATNADIWKLSSGTWASVMQGVAADGPCSLADYRGDLYYGSPDGAYGVLGETPLTATDAGIPLLFVFNDALWASSAIMEGQSILAWFNCETGDYSGVLMPGLRLLTDPKARIAQVGDRLVVPTNAGLMMVELSHLFTPAWQANTAYAVGDVVRHTVTSVTSLYTCDTAHISAAAWASETGFTLISYVSDKWPSLGIPVPGDELDVTLSLAALGGTYLHDCDRDWLWNNSAGVTEYAVSEFQREGTKCTYLNLNCCSANAAWIADHLFQDTELHPTIDQDDDVWIMLWVCCARELGVVSSDNAAESGLRLNIYKTWNTSPYSVADLIGYASIPALTYGWNLCICRVHYVTADTDIVALEIATAPNWALGSESVSFYIDEIKIAKNADVDALVDRSAMSTPETGQSYPAVNREYMVCYARKRLGQDGVYSDKWEVGNPSDVVVTSVAPAGNQVVTVDISKLPGNYPLVDGGLLNANINWVLVYRKIATKGAYLYEYVGKDDTPIMEGLVASASITDDGTAGDYDEENDLPQFSPTQNVPPPIAKYAAHVNGVLWLGGLNYNKGLWLNPGAVACATRYKPAYFPPSPSMIGEGQEWDGFAISGSEVRGLGGLGDITLIFFENEVFAISSAESSSQRPTYLAPVGLASQRTYASNGRIGIWQASDEFYGCDGTRVFQASDNQIDVSLIDLDDPHDAVCTGEHYILYATYDSHPCLLILNLITNGWFVRRLSGMVTEDETITEEDLNLLGIGYDGASDTIYGLSTAGKVVKFFDGDTIWTDAAATGTPVYRIATADIPLESPGRDTTLDAVLIDADAPSSAPDTTLAVTATCKGKKNTTIGPKNITIEDGIAEYEQPINQMSRVVKLSALTSCDASDAATINSLAFTTPARGKAR